MSNKFVPSWQKNGSWMKKKDHPQISEEERLQKLRDEYAEIIKETFPKDNSQYYSDMMAELKEDMAYISDFIENDNLRLRDQYLEMEIERTEKKIEFENKTDYEKLISDTSNEIKNKKEEIVKIMNEIESLSKDLEKEKKTQAYVPRGQKRTISKKELEITARLECLPNEKNKVDEDIDKLEKLNQGYQYSLETKLDKINKYNEYIQYLNDNWENYTHNGITIVLPNV